MTKITSAGHGAVGALARVQMELGLVWSCAPARLQVELRPGRSWNSDSGAGDVQVELMLG